MEEVKNSEEYNPDTLPDLLPIYYKRLFPHQPFYRWLSYGSSEPGIFTNREISFTLMNDIYIRYLSFENENELRNEICSRYPYKIDIGPVMSRRPSSRESVGKMEPVQRELVFDIDLTDYDDVRTCCEGANVCQKCWKYMTVACKILDTALREDFAFEHILWVFSGRRGIHCWVCDRDARHLNTKGRAAIAEYLQILQGTGENGPMKASLGDKIHHSMKRALNIIEPMFENVCLIEQNIFGTNNGINKFLQMIPDENQIRKDFEMHLKDFEGNSIELWNKFIQFVESIRVQGKLIRKMKYIVEEIQLALMYPRLDINVTKGFNHLLKAPFCIHPKTGKLCVPFNPNAAKKFDPTTVPTINTLFEEVNDFDDNEDDTDGKRRIKDMKKTSMLKSLTVFEEFLRKLESSYKNKAITVSDGKMEF